MVSESPVSTHAQTVCCMIFVARSELGSTRLLGLSDALVDLAHLHRHRSIEGSIYRTFPVRKCLGGVRDGHVRTRKHRGLNTHLPPEVRVAAADYRTSKTPGLCAHRIIGEEVLPVQFEGVQLPQTAEAETGELLSGA